MLQMSIYMFNSLIMLILVMIMMLINVAFLTLLERKIMGLFHYRKGPNKVGFMGILQPFSDAIKLLTKEFFLPLKSNMYMYMYSPMLMFLLSMMTWMIYPFFSNLINFKLSILFFLSIISLGVYGLMISGWSSNSSYSMIGSIRSIAQSISYEVIFSINLLIPITVMNSFNINFNMNYNNFIYTMLLFLPMTLILLISMLAEINRTPFDLSEGESELVSGFNVEYSDSKFILIFLAEYSMLMLMMFLFNVIFFSKNFFFTYLNTMLMIFFITWIRMTYPRIRYDKLMYLCWFYLLPLTLINYIYMIFIYKYPLFYIMLYKFKS